MGEVEEEEGCYNRINELWNETLLAQKSLQDADQKIARNSEKVGESESISKSSSFERSRLFEQVGRLYIETSPQKFKEKLENDLKENSNLERSRDLLLMKFKRLESSVRRESEEEPLYYLRRAVSRLRVETEHKSWVIFNVPTGPRLQQGPTCGLVSLVVVARILGRDITTDLLLETGRARGFTKQGEMFSVWDMALLAREVLDTEVRVERAELLEDWRWVLRLLRGRGLVVIPYDCAPDSSVCLASGHRAHWGVVTGIITPSSSPPTQASALSGHPAYHLLQSEGDMEDPEEADRSDLVRLIVRQSKSMELAIYTRREQKISRNYQ